MMLDLPEQVPQVMPGGAITPADERLLWEQYQRQVRLERARADEHAADSRPGWRLTNLGWVGYLPLDSDRGLWLSPKIPLNNLFAMFEWVYGLEALHFLSGESQVGVMEDFYASLAGGLAAGVLGRARQGLYRSYRQRTDDLPFVRGRLQPVPGHLLPVDRVRCQFQEAGPDNLENRLLLAALHRVLHSHLAREPVQAQVRRAYRLLAGSVALRPCTAADCERVVYHRLNRDYRPLHGLARFFLDGSGPSYFQGDRPVLPFLVDMARLFEQFVAAWLSRHLPPGWTLRVQLPVPLDDLARRAVVPDILLYDETGRIRQVLDTKYKTGQPVNEDIYQVVTYAHALGCAQTMLVYPHPVTEGLDLTINNIRVRAVSFPLTEDISLAGRRFLTDLDVRAD